MIKVIGHRGYGPTHVHEVTRSDQAGDIPPENSLAAFRRALSLGADGLEFDVFLSRDGVPMVIHDRHLIRHITNPDRLPWRDAKIFDMTAADLHKLDIGGGERIPTLSEVFHLVSRKDRRLILNLDVKDEDAVTPIRAVMEDIPFAHGHDVLVSSYEWDILRRFRKADPRIRLIPALRTMMLFGPDNVEMPGFVPTTDHYTADAKKLIFDLHREIGIFALDCNFTDVTPDIVTWAKELNVGLMISTGNDRTRLEDINPSILTLLREAGNKELPFVILKVDEPDRVAAHVKPMVS